MPITTASVARLLPPNDTQPKQLARLHGKHRLSFQKLIDHHGGSAPICPVREHTVFNPMTNNDQLATENVELLTEKVVDSLLTKPANAHEERLQALSQALLSLEDS